MYIYCFFYQFDELYIGSTQDFNKRLITHKKSLKYNHQMPFYKYLRDNDLTFNDLELEYINTGIVDTNELLIMEGKCIQLYNPICNINIAGQTKKQYDHQYRASNKEQIKQKRGEYQRNNREKLNEYQRLYNLLNKDKINDKQRAKRAAKKEL